jgi:hypothetical protein
MSEYSTIFYFPNGNSETSEDSELTQDSYSWDYRESMFAVEIGTSCTSIGEYCFQDCTLDDSIIIPTSVTSLKQYCFYECTLPSITIPSSVTSLVDYCFYKCYCNSITIPNTVTSLGISCFVGCTLTSITIPDSVTSLGDSCFYYCKYLVSVIFVNQSNLKVVGGGIFSSCPAMKVYFFSTESYSKLSTGGLTLYNQIPTGSTIYYVSEGYTNAVYEDVKDGSSATNTVTTQTKSSLSFSNTISGNTEICVSFDKILTYEYFSQINPVSVEVGTICDSIESGCFRDSVSLKIFRIKDPRKLISIGNDIFVGCNPMTVIFDFTPNENFLNPVCRKLKAEFPEGSIFIYDPFCFNEGTKILSLNKQLEEEYISIENLRKGDLVKSYKHGYRKVDLIGKNVMINNPELFTSCMYKMEKTDENGLLEDLIITGGHSLLVDDLGSFKEENDKLFSGETLRIDDKYLLLAGVSSDFVKLDNTDKYTYYHFVLENNGDDEERFGVWANGVLTETPSKNFLLQREYIPL